MEKRDGMAKDMWKGIRLEQGSSNFGLRFGWNKRKKIYSILRYSTEIIKYSSVSSKENIAQIFVVCKCTHFTS